MVKNVVKKWNDIKLKSKLLIAFLLLMIVPIMIIFTLTYINLKSSTLEKFLHYNNVLFENAIVESENTLREVEDLKYDFILDDKFMADLSKVSARYLENNKDLEDSFFYTYTLNKMNEFISTKSIVQSVQIINKSSEIYFFSKLQGDVPYTTEDQIRKDFFKEIIKMEGKYVNGKYDKFRNVYVVGCELFTKDKIQPVGELLVSFDLSFVRQIIDKYRLNEGGFYIFDNTTNEFIFKSTDKYTNVAKNIIYGNNYIKASKFMELKQTGELLNWTYIYVVPETILMNNFAYTRRLLVLIFIILTIFACGFALFVSESITSPIQRLIAQMKKVKDGSLKVEKVIERKDEIGELINNFYQMINRINELVIKVYEEEIARKNAEINLLYMQLNPHFLYNTLDTINALAELNRNKDISLLAVSLAKFLRMNMSLNKSLVTVEQEIEHVKYYLTIMKIRFNDKLDYKIKVDEELNKILVPKHLILPFVENSIVHGFENKKENARIVIKVEEHNERIRIEIIDNGKGIQPQKLEDIKRHLQKESIGIHNVLKRLEIFYKENYYFDISSKFGYWTKVTVEIPFKLLWEEKANV